MVERGVVLGIYQHGHAARAVLRQLRRDRFFHAASLLNPGDGRIQLDNARYMLPLCGVVGGGIGLLFGLMLHSYASALLTGVSRPLMIVFWTLVGVILGGIVAHLLHFGVPDALIARYRPWLVKGETMVIVVTPSQQMRRAVELIRRCEGDAPITFVFYPDLTTPESQESLVTAAEPLNPERLNQQARDLATTQAPTKRLKHGRPLLRRLNRSERTLKTIRQHLSEALQVEQGILLSAEWLLDNAYIIQGHIDEVRRSLPRRYYEELPVLTQGKDAGMPRVYGIACALLDATDSSIERIGLNNFLQSYQSVTPLTIGELWALPLMLRLHLIERLQWLAVYVDKRQRERELADFWANRLLAVARHDPDHIPASVAQLMQEMPTPNTHLADQLVSHLYDEEDVLTAVRGWLERKLKLPLQDAFAQEQTLQAMQQISLGNAITSLRTLSQLDWRELFEAVNRVDMVLWNDPADIYAGMDFATRNQYRTAVEEISRTSLCSEIDVAMQALQLALDQEDEVRCHVGYYLVDEGRAELETRVRCRPKVRVRLQRWMRRHANGVYLGTILVLTGSMLAGAWALGARVGTNLLALILICLLAILPLSDIAIQIVNYLVTRLMPPSTLPRMSFAQGIPDPFRTLVVVPMMLLTPDSIRDAAERLEIRYLANPDPNLRFALISDFSDAPEQQMPEDAERLEVAMRALQDLNVRYGEGRFFLFHRERVWSKSERCWMGWERKRGKLEEMNRFLLNDPRPTDALTDSHFGLWVGNREQLEGIRFVITLDEDVQLPRDTGRRMVETLAHPLNQPRLNADGTRMERGFSILQPRVSTSLPSATSCMFTYLFTDPNGADPYTHVVSDVYQDLMGEASYHGKGIYDLYVFHRLLGDRFPESHLLSHDLIEGAHVRVGLVSDIELFDLHPTDYVSYSRRQHRWTRGDWQIMDWITPRVPEASGQRAANPLSLHNRWKILDNLRRSLLPVACVGLLLVSWLLTPHPGFWTGIVGLVLFGPALLQLLTLLTPPWHRGSAQWRDLAVGVVRAGILMALLPHQMMLSLDAIGRVLYRRYVSHSLLLQWETALVAHQRARNRQRLFVLSMAWIPAVALLLDGFLSMRYPVAEQAAAPFLTGWIISPLLVAWLNTAKRLYAVQTLNSNERALLRQVARETWRFFDEFVSAQNNHLPPDNYQALLTVEVARRTSPTNIGLWLLSALSANDLGFITPDELVDRTHATLLTLDQLEKYEGHLFNWYDPQTCNTLTPRYVSSVDSGNLLGALWALAQGYQELLDAPVITPAALQGVADTVALVRVFSPAEKLPDAATTRLADHLADLCKDAPKTLQAMVHRVRLLQEPAHDLVETLCRRKEMPKLPLYWAQQVERQVVAWNALVDRYLGWVEILDKVPEGGLLGLDGDAHEWRREALTDIPSLRMLASGHVPGLTLLIALRDRADAQQLPEAVHGWLNTLADAEALAARLAAERLAQGEDALARTHALADGTNMRFLYDTERKVFAVGYNVDDRRRDNYYYDLLASECRLASFIAVARGEAPVEHWFALGRPFGYAYGHQVLLSWSGTMFEYLMPLLLTRAYPNSLLDQGCRAAVLCQAAYARQRGIPWGISEAGYSALDARQIYQYRAFGVPGLGLKRGLENDLVVAPYASALALEVYPSSAVQNLMRLMRFKQHRLRGEYGYYESIDYTRERNPEGDPGVVIESYMAHHQGMILVAIDNALNARIMQNRFHSDPRVRATESLLYERIPATPAMAKDYAERMPLPRVAASLPGGAVARIHTAETPFPRTHLLSNAEYSLMVTNAGGGYSKWKDMEITRWRADATCDALGSFCYLKDLDTGEVWSTAYQPTRIKPQRYTAAFSPEKAEFRRRDYEIETVLEVVVTPEDNAEIRRLTLINHSTRPRRIELTSYAEIALAPHNADRAHPAFSKLFVQTEALAERNALLASRRPRSAQDPEIWAMHIIAGQPEVVYPFLYETDRMRFLGRGRTVSRPTALEQDLSNTVGAVLDPIFSLRRVCTLEPGERCQVAFITGAGDSREKMVEMAAKYTLLGAADRAVELAWTHAQLDLRHLRLQSEEAMRFQQLAGYILYPGSTLRPTEDRLRRNTLPQTGLWAHGISGDLPIVVVTIEDASDIELVRQVLMAHVYWRMRGLKCDLVILNEEASSYEQPLQDQLRRLIQVYSAPVGTDQPGGVFLRPAAQLPDADLTLLLTVARISLVAARGNLAQQLGTVEARRPVPMPLANIRHAAEEPSAALPFMDLAYFNGLGGFTQDGKEYVIYLGPGSQTPTPWINVIANPQFGMTISESGAGFTWYGNSQSNRLTPWKNDPVSDPIGDAIYIRDEDLGVVWSPTAAPIRELDAYRARHGQGYTAFEHNSHAIEQQLTTFVPVDDKEGAPVRIQILRLRNRSSRRRRLTLTAFVEWALGVEREETQMHVVTQWDAGSRTLLARNAYNPDFGSRIAFLSASLPVVSYTGDRAEFLGRNGRYGSPAALLRVGLSNRTGAGMDPCGALQTAVEIDPGQETEVVFLLGQGANVEECRALVQKYRSPEAAKQTLRETRAWWDKTLGVLQVETPELSVDLLLNRWLLYQDLSCRLWGRSALYQSGGAYGFRDQLQDVMALVYADPQATRAQILRSAARQFLEGDVQHWWHPPSGAGVRTRISDDLLWLPFVTAQYVRVTGDLSVVDENAPFLEGKPLSDKEHEVYNVPIVSSQSAPIMEHCRRALEKGLTAGPHGLPLIGAGDWNDGMNRVGVEGKGESVWLAWFLVHVLNDYAELLRRKGDPSQADGYEEKARQLAKIVEAQAWDGGWYVRAYFDDGTPVGSAQCEEAKIDSLPQSWAVISGAADPKRAEQALQAVEQHLVKEADRMVLLFTPPFDKTTHDPGYIKGYLPGVRENGGQYTHGSLWVPLAFARRGDGDKATHLLRLMNPIEHARDPEAVQRYKVEPYVVVADIYALEGQTGRGGWTWYTGSAGWMYRVWLEEVLGFKRRGATLQIDPVICSAWDGFTLRYRFQSTLYTIVVENPEHVSHGVGRVEMEGNLLADGLVPLQDEGGERHVRVVLGSGSKQPPTLTPLQTLAPAERSFA